MGWQFWIGWYWLWIKFEIVCFELLLSWNVLAFFMLSPEEMQLLLGSHGLMWLRFATRRMWIYSCVGLTLRSRKPLWKRKVLFIGTLPEWTYFWMVPMQRHALPFTSSLRAKWYARMKQCQIQMPRNRSF